MFNTINLVTMKKVFMSLAVVAAMFAAASCACNNNSEKAGECAATECADCAGCDKAEKPCDASCEKECCDSTKCAQCDSTCVDCKKAE